MSKRDAGDRAGAIAALGKLICHPGRVAMIEAFSEERPELSPSDLAAVTGEPIGNAAYHVRRLEATGVVELTGTASRRGAIEHYYRLTARGRELQALLGRL